MQLPVQYFLSSKPSEVSTAECNTSLINKACSRPYNTEEYRPSIFSVCHILRIQPSLVTPGKPAGSDMGAESVRRLVLS